MLAHQTKQVTFLLPKIGTQNETLDSDIKEGCQGEPLTHSGIGRDHNTPLDCYSYQSTLTNGFHFLCENEAIRSW